jgi:hypothetical protein
MCTLVEQELLTIPEHRIIMIYRLIVRHMCTLVEQELLTIPEYSVIMIYRLIVRHMCTLVEQELLTIPEHRRSLFLIGFLLLNLYFSV